MKKSHLLLITTGMSPAVITETVYALNMAKDLPAEVIAITTSTGKNEIMKQLFGADKVWETMLAENGLTGKILFGEANIRLIPDENRNYSEDIISSSDNNELANSLLDILRSYTENPDTRVSFSIAGGRKSMSAVGALVMSLLGRRQDKTYHILVSPPFDNPRISPRFYYPRDIEHKLADENYSGLDAQLQLGEIPFVRSRYWLNDKGITTTSYFRMVDEINNKLLNVTIDTGSQKIFIGDKTLSPSYLGFCIYWMFAERHISGKNYLEHGANNEMLDEVFENFIAEKEIIVDNDAKPDEHKGKKEYIIKGYQMETDFLRKKGISELNTALKGFDERLEINQGRNIWGIRKSFPKECIIIK